MLHRLDLRYMAIGNDTSSTDCNVSAPGWTFQQESLPILISSLSALCFLHLALDASITLDAAAYGLDLEVLGFLLWSGKIS